MAPIQYCSMRIRYKLFLSILVTAFVSVFALQQAQRYSFESGLKRYSQSSWLERLDPLVLVLADIYERDNGWGSLRGQAVLPVSEVLIRSNINPNKRGHRPPKLGRRPPGFGDPKKHFSGLTLLDQNKKYIAGAAYDASSLTKSIELDGATIGYLAVPPVSDFTRIIDKRFSKQQQTGRLWALIVILIGALLSAFLISRSLGRPIKNLVEQVQKLSDGHYNFTFIDEKSDEFGSLSFNLNRLAATLRDNRTHRQQWISDISHELRTPVAVLQAEIECIEDSHKPLDKNSLSSLKSEVARLSHLIGDLHQLSQADSGALSFNFSMCNIASEVNDAIKVVQERFTKKNISVKNGLSDLPLVYGDSFRLRQVIDNLIENTLRYTDEPGTFKIFWRLLEDEIELSFEDSAPSVPEPYLPKLFDRLYRTDPSRSRATGASGLGLSICQSIISVHGGEIVAERSSLGGLAIRFTLPTVDPRV